MKYILCIVILFMQISLSAGGVEQKVLQKDDVYYLSNEIIVQLKYIPQTDGNGFASLTSGLLASINYLDIKEAKVLFPQSQLSRSSSLSQIVSVKYAKNIDPFFVSSKLKSNPDIDWAEPRFLYELQFTPNDPSYSQQYALTKISAPAAWDISQGDTNVVIGIVDTGVDWDHPDLNANIWRNWNEIPGNGIDDDNNGFIDDFIGWDFGGLNGTPDNNPVEDRPDHGTHVAGISSAVTNNGIGVASIGFKCKIMAVKASRDDLRNSQGQALIAYGYEGIIYAAENGADIINLSWGGSGYSIFSQQTINYATSLGALVVAACGNSNSSGYFYPAAYDNVLAVASTTQTDAKSSFSNFGYYVDVSAPGSSIYNTWFNDTYATLSGTSMASPLTAGLAGLVKSHFPNYSPAQIGQVIRVTSDNINSINPSYVDLLGKGRINAASALSQTNAKSVRGVSFTFSDELGDNDGIFEPGEQITLSVNFINYLSPVSSLTVTLTAQSSAVNVTNGIYNAGSQGTLSEFSNSSSKFAFIVPANAAQNSQLVFKLIYSDGTYSDYQWVTVIVNPTYATQNVNEIALTVTSKGTLAYNDFGTNLQGDGFKYQGGSNLMFEGALMLATSASQVSDAARNSSGNSQNNDFAFEQPFTFTTQGSPIYAEGSCILNDNNAGSNKIGVRIFLNTYSYSQQQYKNLMILRYRLINTNSTTINNLYAGLFFDWDLIDGSGDNDVIRFDNQGNLGYVYNTTGNPSTYVGMKVLTNNFQGFHALNNDGSGGSINIYDGFTDAEKFTTLTSGLNSTNAGPADASCVISAGALSIAPGDTAEFAIAIFCGESLDDLRNEAVNSLDAYNNLVITSIDGEEDLNKLSFALFNNYPNPFNPNTVIKFRIPETALLSEKIHTTLKIFDILGKEVAILLDEDLSPGEYNVVFNTINYNIPSGVYFYRLNAGSYSDIKKMVLIK